MISSNKESIFFNKNAAKFERYDMITHPKCGNFSRDLRTIQLRGKSDPTFQAYQPINRPSNQLKNLDVDNGDPQRLIRNTREDHRMGLTLNQVNEMWEKKYIEEDRKELVVDPVCRNPIGGAYFDSTL